MPGGEPRRTQRERHAMETASPLHQHLQNTLVTKLPMWSEVEIEVWDGGFALLVAMPAKVTVTGIAPVMRVVPAFRLSVTDSSANAQGAGKRGGIPAEFAEHNDRMRALLATLDVWWTEIVLTLWLMSDD